MSGELIYRDGSANAYHVAPDGRFEYVPVRPEHSSTGMYSGGAPRSGVLDASTLAALWDHVRMLEANTAVHADARGKGTGLFVVTDAAGERTFLVARGPALAAFDAFVGGLR